MSARNVLPFLAIALVAADEPPKDAKKELEKFQGEWTMVSLETRGQKAPEETVKGMKLTVKGAEWVVTRDGTTVADITFQLDPSKDPKAIDLTFKVDGKETALKGIYKLDGDTLTLCRTDSPVAARPTAFKTTVDGGVLAVWKRAKK